MYFDINEIVKRELEDIGNICKALEASVKKNDKKMKQKPDKTLKKSNESSETCYIYERNTKEGLVYYKHVVCGDKQRTIRLGGSDNAEVIRIKQDRFNKALLKRLKRDIALLKKISGKFLSYDPDSVDNDLRPVYRDQTGLVNKTPGIVNQNEWNKINRENRFEMPENCNITFDGAKTRSKSELIEYGVFKGYGLIIKYDVEIKLKNEIGQTVVVSPDFVILCDDGSIIIVEHLGMLDDPEYLKNALKKIHLYLINGYKLNENLFLTADCAQGKINAQVIDELVRKMILPRVRGRAA